MTPFKRFWQVVCESREVTGVLARRVLGEDLAVYRDETGAVVVAQDRCLHRCARLSSGTVEKGRLQCRYHGWVYGVGGRVVHMPSEGENVPRLKALTYRTVEQDGYIYVCLRPDAQTPDRPMVLPRPKGQWRHIRLQNAFKNSVANCVENYIDVPHTAFVHKGVFRKSVSEAIDIDLSRRGDHVSVTYHNERMNLGAFSWLLNPGGGAIQHSDHFFAPHTTSVHYELPNGFSYFITSQSIARDQNDTLVFTDISYDFGLWSRWFDPITRRIVRHQAQTVIDQDISILNEQGEVIAIHGEKFYQTTADAIHVEIHNMINQIERGEPLPSSEVTQRLRIWV